MHLTNRLRVIFLFGLAGAAGVSGGCSRAATVCSLICDCEHCNDYEEDEACTEYDTSQNIAEAYDCGDAWDAYLVCVEDKGRCKEEEADFTTRAPGSCSGKQATGISCATAADCFGGPGTTCESGTCMARFCSGINGGESCET